MVIQGLTPDQEHYFKLHGARRIKDGVVAIKLKRFKIEPELNRIRVLFECVALKDNLCVLHGKDSQPDVCRFPNKHDKGEGQVVVTENCLWGLE